MRKLVDYFSSGISSRTLETVGMEIETQFVDEGGRAIQPQVTQTILELLLKNGWDVCGRRNGVITTITDERGNKIFWEFEMGRHHLEIATAVSTPTCVLDLAEECLTRLYNAAYEFGAMPHCAPILKGAEDLLITPVGRDTAWIDLDGRDVLAPLARTSSVHFTISVAAQEAVAILNRFGEHTASFLADYPQDAMWRRYIADSSAKYLPDRYGGPLLFESLNDYCQKIVRHDIVQGIRLVPYAQVDGLDIPSYTRSIWWYFRLRRYENDLCVEIRPVARRSDEQLSSQLERILEIACA